MVARVDDKGARYVCLCRVDATTPLTLAKGLPAVPNMRPKTDSTGLCTASALTCTSTDEFTFELSQATEHRQHQPAMRSRSVCPTILEGPEASPGLGHRVQHIEQVPRGSRQPIQPRHDKHVNPTRALVGASRAPGGPSPGRSCSIRALAARPPGRPSLGRWCLPAHNPELPLPGLPLSQLTYAIKTAAAICSQCAVERLPSLAIERVLRPSAANNTICARFTSPCGVPGARQRASSILRICRGQAYRRRGRHKSKSCALTRSAFRCRPDRLWPSPRPRLKAIGQGLTGQDKIQPGPGSRSPSQKRTLPVQRSIRRAVGASPVQWFVSVIAAAINAPATTSVTCCRFMPSLRPPRSAHEMRAGTANSPYRCSVFSAVLPQNPHAPQAGR